MITTLDSCKSLDIRKQWQKRAHEDTEEKNQEKDTEDGTEEEPVKSYVSSSCGFSSR